MAAVACSLSFGSNSAAADATEDSALALTLSWDAPATCPTRDEVDARVRELLAGSQRKETAQANVVVTHRRDRRDSWSADIRTRVGGAQGRRTLSAASCDRLASATALVIALTIDPDLQVEPPAPEPPPKPPEPVAPPPPPPPVHDDDTTPRTTTGLQIGVRAAAVGGVGSLPSAAGGIGLGLSLNLRPWRFEAYGEGWLPRSATASSPEGAGGDFSLFDVGVRGCITSDGRVFLGACAGIEVDRVHAQGFGITREDTASRVWLAPRAGGRVGVRITENLELPLELDIVVPLARPSFALESANSLDGPASRVDTIFRPAPVAARASLGLAFLFR